MIDVFVLKKEFVYWITYLQLAIIRLQRVNKTFEYNLYACISK